MKKFYFFVPFLHHLFATITKTLRKFNKNHYYCRRHSRQGPLFKHFISTTQLHAYIHSNLKPTMRQPPLFRQSATTTPAATATFTADTPGPGRNFTSLRPGQAAGRRSAESWSRLFKLRPGLGVSAYAPKSQNFKFRSFFRNQKLSSPPGTPTGSGFRQSCSKIFR